MNKQTTQVRHKVRQFQWFEMETRVRQITQQLIAPFSKRLFQTLGNISSLKSFTMQEARKLTQLKKVVIDDPTAKQIDIFKAIEKKHDDLQLQIAEIRNLVGQTQKVMDRRFEIQDQRHQQSKAIILNNMKLKQRISEQIMQQNNSLKQFMQHSQLVMDDFSRSLDSIIKTHQDDTKSIQQQISKLDHRILLLEDFEKDTYRRFSMNKEEHVNFNKQILKTQQDLSLSIKEIEALNKNLSYTKKLSSYVKQLEQKIHKQEFQAEYLAPLVTQAQITQTLYSILPSKLKKRLIIYDYYQFGKLNATILDTQIKNHNEKFNGVQMLETVEKRTTKIIVDMKRKKLIQQGVDVDNLTYQMKQKHFKQVDLHQEYPDEQQDQKQVAPLDRQEITLMVQVMVNLGKNQLTRHISSQFQGSRNYILSLEEQLQHNLNMSNQLIDKLKDQIQSFKTEQVLLNKYLQDKLDQQKQSSFKKSKELSSIKQSLNDFIKFCSLVNHLQIQDEIDKQSISLFGVRESFNDQPNNQNQQTQILENSKPPKIIDIKKQCFSCCGFPASTMAAFKMACLTYSPSSIVLQNKQFRRQQILQMSTKLLKHLKQQLINTHTTHQTYFSQLSSCPETQRKFTTLPQQTQINNIFLYNTKQLDKSSLNKDLRQSKDLKDYRQRNKRMSTTNSNIRTSTRLSSSLRTTKKRTDVSLLTTIFTQQQKKHEFYLS